MSPLSGPGLPNIGSADIDDIIVLLQEEQDVEVVTTPPPDVAPDPIPVASMTAGGGQFFLSLRRKARSNRYIR